MDISALVAIIPVILAVALVIAIVRRNITEREPGQPVDLTGAIPAVIILMIAVILIGSMAASVSPYTWDEDSGELTINQDVGTGDQKWDPLGADVKSLIINDNVETVADGAFDTLTGLEYISISDSVESITSSAFGVTLKDCLGQTITEPEAGEYVGAGDGTLYYCDSSIFTYNSTGTTITGLTSSASTAEAAILPTSHDGITLTTVGTAAFQGNSSIVFVGHVPDCEISTLNLNSFRECTALETVDLPDSITTTGASVFRGCTALETIDLPSGLSTLVSNLFTLSGLTSISVPEVVTTIESSAFLNCSSLTSVSLPASIESIGATAFTGDTAITTVTVEDGFEATLGENWASSWTFYDSDGTTELDNTVASNLAGFTFQGTASALVKVVEGAKSLTTEQALKVQELTKAAALTESKTLAIEEKESAEEALVYTETKETAEA